jgi:hypothetical protein
VTLLPERISLVLFGSWGRFELTDESDDDWALLVDDSDLNLEGPAVLAALEHLRDVFDAGKPPGRQAYFGCAFHRERIGLDEDDTRNLTRRMLLLLESVAATGTICVDFAGKLAQGKREGTARTSSSCATPSCARAARCSTQAGCRR